MKWDKMELKDIEFFIEQMDEIIARADMAQSGDKFQGEILMDLLTEWRNELEMERENKTAPPIRSIENLETRRVVEETYGLAMLFEAKAVRLKEFAIELSRSPASENIKAVYSLFLPETVTPVPGGSNYCEGCNAITPHHNNFSTNWGENADCCICGDNNQTSGWEVCDNCGFTFPDDHMYDRIKGKETVHHPGCHVGDETAQEITKAFFRDNLDIPYKKADRFLLLEEADVKCGCPEYEVIYRPDILSYRSWPGHGMDCLYHVEWEYEIRCPICGFINYFSNSNC